MRVLWPQLGPQGFSLLLLSSAFSGGSSSVSRAHFARIQFSPSTFLCRFVPTIKGGWYTQIARWLPVYHETADANHRAQTIHVEDS
eukprot:1067102-Amphidinium_carterae.1